VPSGSRILQWCEPLDPRAGWRAIVPPAREPANRLIERRLRAGFGSVADMAGSGGAARSLPLILARELASNLATPMFLMDAAGALVYYNEAADGLIGRSFAELGEIPVTEFGEMLRLRDVGRAPLRRRDTPTAIAFSERRPAHRVLRATGYDGVERVVEVTAYPLFGTADEMHGVVTVFWQTQAPSGGT
jgi:PAS domain-containing protein